MARWLQLQGQSMKTNDHLIGSAIMKRTQIIHGITFVISTMFAVASSATLLYLAVIYA